MSINPDAHATREIDLMHWGVEMARKGGVPRDRVLNCFSTDEVASYFEKRRAPRQKVTALQQHRRPRPRASSPATGKRSPSHKNRKAAGP
jgi:DNA polymerase (family X)